MLRTDPWFAYHAAKPQAELRLFCFPYAGGGASIYRMWNKSLPPSVEVWPVQIPGRESRIHEPPFNRLPALVETLVPVLRPYLDRPFAFFGHSMGARISFELARRIKREYEMSPLHLFVSGCPAPQLRMHDPPAYDLPEEEFLAALRRLNGTPQEVFEHVELLQLMIPLLRADFAVCQTYCYAEGPPLNCDITALGGMQDPEVSREELAAWREQTASRFSVYMLPGDHFYLHEAQLLLVQILSQKLCSQSMPVRLDGRSLIGGKV